MHDIPSTKHLSSLSVGTDYLTLSFGLNLILKSPSINVGCRYTVSGGQLHCALENGTSTTLKDAKHLAGCVSRLQLSLLVTRAFIQDPWHSLCDLTVSRSIDGQNGEPSSVFLTKCSHPKLLLTRCAMWHTCGALLACNMCHTWPVPHYCTYVT